MNTIKEKLTNLKATFDTTLVTLIAVSKTYPIATIKEAYQLGLRDFGENKVQEMTEKYEQLPKDVKWHLIGHLQTNKVKFIAPFVHLIHGVDSLKLLQEINKQAAKCERIINCLLQVYIADEETKFGLTYDECLQILNAPDLKLLQNIKIVGLMGIATNTDDQTKIHNEFKSLNSYFNKIKVKICNNQIDFKFLSMGMSNDYAIAIAEGSNMIRVGSAIFGSRLYL